jgi:hypothetical protein
MQSSSDTVVSTFEIDASAALQVVRKSFSDLIEATGQSIERPTDLQKILEVDSKLSWQIFNVINEEDTFAAAKLVPGDPSVKRLLQAVKKLGVSEKVCQTVRSAVEQFNQVVERHAEDRTEFDFMASSLAKSVSSASTAETAFRRMAFRGESHIWGVCADALCAATIVRRAADGDTTDECTISHKLNCRRLRPDAPTSIFAYRNYGADGPSTDRTRLPLDSAAAERYGAGLMPKFCSQPIPALKTRLRPDGWTAVDMQSAEVGRQSSISLTFGQIFRRCPFARSISGEPLYQNDIRFTTPFGLLISYMLVHRPSFGQVKPRLQVFRQTPGDEDEAVALSAPQVPTREQIVHVGSGRAAWRNADIVGYDDMVQAAFDEIGWNPAEFDVYRVRIEYPALFSVIRMQFTA